MLRNGVVYLALIGQLLILKGLPENILALLVGSLCREVLTPIFVTSLSDLRLLTDLIAEI